jgi:hypothetical protein
MPNNLRPCPFCGNSAMWAASPFEGDFEIQCSYQDCEVLIICGGKTEAQAAAKWNHRCPDPWKAPPPCEVLL